MRVSEVVGLKYYYKKRARQLGKERYRGLCVEDIDYEQRILRVLGKGEKERKVVIDLRTMTLLKDYIMLKQIESGVVFKMTPRNVELMLKKYGEKAGIAHLHPHKLRHTWSVSAFRCNVGGKNVADQLGHNDPKFTAQQYGKIAADDRRKDIDEKMESDW
jgi:integrase